MTWIHDLTEFWTVKVNIKPTADRVLKGRYLAPRFGHSDARISKTDLHNPNNQKPRILLFVGVYFSVAVAFRFDPIVDLIPDPANVAMLRHGRNFAPCCNVSRFSWILPPR